MRFNPGLLIALVALQINFAFGADAETVYNYNITAAIRDLTEAKTIPNLPLTLFKLQNDDWIIVSDGKTAANGQYTFTSTKYEYTTGTYKLRYNVSNYYDVTFYPLIDVTFDVTNLLTIYALPVQIYKYGFSTYQGVFD